MEPEEGIHPPPGRALPPPPLALRHEWSSTWHVYSGSEAGVSPAVVMLTPPPGSPVSHAISLPPPTNTHSVGVQGKNRGSTMAPVVYSAVSASGSQHLRQPRCDVSMSRSRAILMLSSVKAAANTPAVTPMTAAGAMASTCVEKESDASNATSLSNHPKWPRPMRAAPALLDRLSASVAHVHAKNTCHPSECCQNDATSSNANSRPPMGALNAVATPTDTPAVTKSRLSLGLRKRRNRPVLKRMVVEWPCEMAEPSAAPMCTSGPSGPTGSPAPTASAHDRNLAASVCTLNTRGTMQPLR
mmetsp:Transcript_2266/g.5761  ORF Transcript_2266/g.5761 Transcript_2266/m.5761 type:complete len:300 (+) Transcript_2266:225-1124(+)